MAFRDDLQAPQRLQTDEFLIRQLVVADNELDYEAVMDSKQSLRLWEGTTWPEDDFTLEANLADMVKMEERHTAGDAFGYTVMNPDETQCLGCVYVFATDRSWLASMDVTPVGDAQWSEYDTAVYFWIRESRVADGLDRRVLDALDGWFTTAWAIENHVIVTSEPFEQQVKMLEGSELTLRFRMVDPDEPGTSLAFA